MKMLQGRKGRKSGVVVESKSSTAEGKPASGKFWCTERTFVRQFHIYFEFWQNEKLPDVFINFHQLLLQ